MSKFLSLLCGIVFLLWYFHFDPDEYLEKKQGKVEEPKLHETNTKLPDRAEEVAPKATKTSTLIFPLANKSLKDVISGYGEPRNKGARIHEGIDIPAPKGTPVLAVADGMITKVANKGNAGKQVWLKVGNEQYFYAHLDSWKVEEGEMVEKGKVIGTVGNTGNASHTLPHLHFGVYVSRGKTADPSGYLE